MRLFQRLSFIRSSFVRFDIFNFCYLKTPWHFQTVPDGFNSGKGPEVNFTSFSSFSRNARLIHRHLNWLTFFSPRLNSELPSGHVKGLSCWSIMLSLCSLWPPLMLLVFLVKTTTAAGSGEGKERLKETLLLWNLFLIWHNSFNGPVYPPEANVCSGKMDEYLEFCTFKHFYGDYST